MDPTLQWLFLEGEWRSTHELPILGHSLVLDCVRMTILSSVISVNVGAGQSGCHLKWWPENKQWNCPCGSVNNWQNESRKPGHDDYLLPQWPAKVESLEVLSTLCQWDSPKPRMVVVRIFANSPYIPWGSFGLPYLDVTVSSRGCISQPIPFRLTVPLAPAPLLLNTHYPAVWRGRGKKLKVYPILQEALWESSEEEHCLWFLPLGSFSFPSSLFSKMRVHRLRRSLALAQLWCTYNTLPGPKSSLSEN